MNLKRFFGDRIFLKTAAAIAFPIMLQNLLTTSFTLIDTLMISSLGETPLAAVGLAASWGQLYNVVLFGVSSGAGVLVAQYWGARNNKDLRHSYGLGLLMTLTAALFFMAVTLAAPGWVMRLFSADQAVIAAGADYLRLLAPSYPAVGLSMIWGATLRSTERVRIPLYGSLVCVVVNVFLNYTLIFGHFGAPALGLSGAAIASCVANWLGALTVFLLGTVQKTMITGLRGVFSLPKGFGKHFFSVALPILGNECVWGGGTAVLNMVYGHMGTTEYAALTIYRTVENLVMVIFISLSNAATVLVGKEIGSGNRERAWRNAVAMTCWTPLLAAVCSGAIILLRGPITGFFAQSDQVIRLAELLLIISAFEYPLRFVSFVHICGIFRAGADGRTAMLYDLLGVWAVAVPLAAVGLLLHLPFLTVYTVVIFADSGLKLVLCLRRFLSRRWMVNAAAPDD